MRTILGMIVGLVVVSAVSAYQNGDVDHSGFLSCTDLQLILNYVTDQDDSKLDTDLADVNNSGTITAYDATLIQIMCGGCKGIVLVPTTYDRGNPALPTNTIMNAAFPNAAENIIVLMKDDNDGKLYLVAKKTGSTWCLLDGTALPN